jgi:outer membrane lipoprotein-sorting protein
MKSKLILTLLLLFGFFAHAQTADEIIAKYLAKTGGVEKWKALKTRKMIGKMTMQGQEIPITMFEKPKMMKRTELRAPGFVFIQVYNGTEGWMLNPAMGTEPIKLTDEQTKDFAEDEFEDDFIDYKKKGYEATFIGTEELDGIKCFKIQLVKNNAHEGEKTIHYFDAETYFPAMDISYKKDDAQKIMEVKNYEGDYREVNGLMFPFYQEAKWNGQTLEKITIEKIILDEPIEDSLFTLAKK